MNDLVQQQNPNPSTFQRALAANGGAINAGAVAIETERAIAEAQGQLTLAKRFPRDLNVAHAELMLACKSKAFAETAFYSKPQGGGKVEGPSIRMAEEIARVYGNIQYGNRELSRDDSKSEVEIFFWDMEKNNYVKRQKTVLHVVDTREGPRKMRDQTQIDQKINNVASKEVRGLILAGVAKWLVADAIAECKKTLAGNNDEPLEVRVRKMTQAFAKYGVTTHHLEKYLGHSLDQVLLDELVDLQGTFNLLRDGTPASELFSSDDAADVSETSGAPKAIADAAAAGKKTQAQPATGNAAKPARGASKPAENVGNVVKDAAPSVAKKGQEVGDDQQSDSVSTSAPIPAPTIAPAQAANASDEEEVF